MSGKRLSNKTVDTIATARAHLSDVLGDDDPLLKPKQTKKERKRLKRASKKQAAKALRDVPSGDVLADAILAECSRHGVRIVNKRPAPALAKSSPAVARGWRFIDAMAKQRRLDKLTAIVDAAYAKAEAEKRTARYNADLAKSRDDLAKSKVNIRKSTIQANESKAATKRMRAEIDRESADIARRMTTVETNYNRALEQVNASNARRLEKAELTIDTEARSWIVRADATTDADLKVAFLQNARDLLGSLDDE